MTRTATTKLVATALAVASLGLTASAQAAEEQGIVAGEQDVQVQQNTPAPAPAQPAEEEAPATQAAQEEEEIDYSSPEYFKSDEAKERFKRVCNMKDAEPSHSDKKFCEDFRKHNPTTTTTTTPGGKGHGYENHKYKGHKYEETGYKKPVYEAKKALGKELPYTGLEMWQLGLIGIVLSGGGLGARRLLAS